MTKILLVEDNANLCYIIRSGLEDMIGGYEVTTANNGEEGIKLYKEQSPDVILADIEMPIMNGFDMVAHIREIDKTIPILFTSGCISPKFVVTGYKLGANNYIKKPFIPEELDAHIKAVLKMSEGIKMRNESDTLQIGPYKFDPKHGLLKSEEKTIHLTTRESQILELLAKDKGDIVKRDTIERICWGKEKEGDFFTSRSLDVFIAHLRTYFKDVTGININTIKGIGLSLTDK